MDEFLRSKVVMSPGAAGAATTTITGTLVSQFDLPGLWTCLVISLLFGIALALDVEKGTPVVKRIVFFVLNSATIFAFSIGINHAGVEVTKSEQERQFEQRWIEQLDDRKGFFQEWF